MRSFLLAIICILSLPINAQDNEIINWINNNAIKIEDADPDTELLEFRENIPTKFANAKFSDLVKLLTTERNFLI